MKKPFFKLDSPLEHMVNSRVSISDFWVYLQLNRLIYLHSRVYPQMALLGSAHLKWHFCLRRKWNGTFVIRGFSGFSGSGHQLEVNGVLISFLRQEHLTLATLSRLINFVFVSDFARLKSVLRQSVRFDVMTLKTLFLAEFCCYIRRSSWISSYYYLFTFWVYLGKLIIFWWKIKNWRKFYISVLSRELCDFWYILRHLNELRYNESRQHIHSSSSSACRYFPHLP
jgi:hypothetical protein